MPLIAFEKTGNQSSSLVWRIAFSILATLLAIPAAYRSYQIFRANRIALSGETVLNYSLALEHDPSDATLWWKRGRLRHYSVGKVELDLALQDYKKALELNPRIGQAWVDLADVYERTGKPAEAAAALEKAFAANRYSPLIRWQAGNFYLRQGNLPKMYECFRIACQYDVSKLAIATDLAWKIDPDHVRILQNLIPDTLPANTEYLNFLIRKNELDLAYPAWQRCLKNEIPRDFEMKPSLFFGYIDRLLEKNQVTESLEVWEGSLRKSSSGLSDVRWKTPGQNLIWNGSFEHEILRGGFDWRFPDVQEAAFQADIGNRMDGLKSLQVVFGGANISTGYLEQIVPIFSPGSYVLEFSLQTKELTTDQTPYFSIEGYPNPSCASAHSIQFPPSVSWCRISTPFTVKEGCKAIRVLLSRDRSRKFDNKIKGSLWLDNVAIRPQTGAEKDNAH
jgi:hypothetical protein